MSASGGDDQGVVGRRGCARPAGCCAGGPPVHWCAALRASLAAAPDGRPALAGSAPRLDAPVVTEQGPGRIARIQMRRRVVSVALASTGVTVELPVAAVRPVADST